MSEGLDDGDAGVLRSQMRSMLSQLVAVSSSLQRQKKVSSELKVSEDMLVDFIEEFFRIASSAQSEITMKTRHLGRLGDRLVPVCTIHALDLAGFVSPYESLGVARVFITKFQSFVVGIFEQLEGKREKFVTWKIHHSQESRASVPAVSPSIRLPIVNHVSFSSSVEQMKRQGRRKRLFLRSFCPKKLR